MKQGNYYGSNYYAVPVEGKTIPFSGKGNRLGSIDYSVSSASQTTPQPEAQLDGIEKLKAALLLYNQQQQSNSSNTMHDDTASITGDSIPNAPTSTEHSNSCDNKSATEVSSKTTKIQIRLHNGSKIESIFDANQTIQDIRNFVDR
jgi:hypothetical protein